MDIIGIVLYVTVILIGLGVLFVIYGMIGLVHRFIFLSAHLKVIDKQMRDVLRELKYKINGAHEHGNKKI